MFDEDKLNVKSVLRKKKKLYVIKRLNDEIILIDLEYIEHLYRSTECVK